LIKPFQPTVERGFSKYTRITTSRSSASRAACPRSSVAYSPAASGSCTEHGPTTTSSRRSRPASTSCTWWRLSSTVSCRSAVSGSSWWSSAGLISGTTAAMR
jgi:hypothetical protein